MNHKLRAFHQKYFQGKNMASSLIIIGLLVVFLLLSNNLLGSAWRGGGEPEELQSVIPVSKTDQPTGSVMVKHANQLEERLSQAFTQVAGVGNNTVMVTLSSTVTQVVAQDSNFSESSTLELAENGDSREVTSRSQSLSYVTTGTGPLVLTTQYPQVEGVIIVAQGGGDPVIVEALINATRAVLGIEANRVSVLPMAG